MKLRYIAYIRLPTEKAHGFQIMSMCSAFARAGAEVELLVPTRATPIDKDPFEYYGVPKNFTIRRIAAPQPRDFSLSSLSRLSYLWARFVFAWRALRDARRRPADMYYHRDEIVFCAFGRAGLRGVWEVHDMPRHLSRYAKALDQSKLVVAITEGLKRALVSEGVAPELVTVEPDGVDVQRFATAASEGVRHLLGITQDDVVVSYIGSLLPWKGVPTFIDAAAGLPASAYILVVGGEGAQLEAIRGDMKKNSVRGQAIGRVDPSAVPEYFAASDVIVIPNSAATKISREYTSPLKLFEALAAGKAIVASDIPSLREVLDDDTAIFVPPDDPAALRRALTRLASDGAKRAHLAARAKECAARYDWTARAKRILARLSQV